MNQLARVAPQQSAALASPSNLGDLQVLGGVLARSGFFTDARDAAQAMVKVMAGAELGFGPIASMTGIYVVKGRITLSANLIAAAIKRSGKYDFRVREISPERCEIEFFQGSESIGVSIATMAEAKAGKWDMDWDRDSKSWKPKQTWQSFPKNMLYARALSNGAKWFVSDVFGGPIYEPDEMGLQIDAEGEVVTTREEQPRQQPPRLQAVPTATPAATIEAEPLADAEQVAAINALWPEFGVRGAVSGVLKPLAEYLAGKWGVSAPEELSVANAGTLIKWMQQRQLAAQHPEPPKAAPGAGLDAWKCTQESGGRALAMEILSATEEVEALGYTEAAWRDELKIEFGVDSRKELTAEQAEAWRDILRNLVVALKAKAAAATE